MNNSSLQLITDLTDRVMNRRTLLRSAVIGAGLATFSPLLAACGEEDIDDDAMVEEDDDVDDDPAAEVDDDEVAEVDDDPAVEEDDDDLEDAPVDAEGVFGGTLTVAHESPVHSLDIQSITTGPRMFGQHIFETLLAYGEDYSTQPLLAESWEWDDDGLALTFHLREDVLFHNGDPMLADDVVASIERYMEAGSRGVVGEMIDSVREIDDSTVEITVPEVNSAMIPTFTSPLIYIGILPREAIEGKDHGEVEAAEDLIGTGPYQVDVWVPDDELELVRFDDYYQTEGERDGYAGAKVAYFDRIVFTAVPEAGTRISGLLTGESDFALALPRPERNRLEGDPDVSPVIGGPGSTQTVPFNHYEGAGWSADRTFRQAVQAAIDCEDIAMLTLGGDPDFFELNPSIYRIDQVWWTDVAADTYNQHDPERARQLLDEAGYDGEEIILVYDIGVDVDVSIVTALTEQLEEVGINIDARGVDSATRGELRASQEGWHMLTDGMTVRFTPADWDATLACATGRANWCNEEMETTFEELRVTLDEDEQKPLSDEIQRIHHEHVYALHLFDGLQLIGQRNDIMGFEQWYHERFWGVWREE
jgi:peptide/nickel transport system substrate-binding protein